MVLNNSRYKLACSSHEQVEQAADQTQINPGYAVVNARTGLDCCVVA